MKPRRLHSDTIFSIVTTSSVMPKTVAPVRDWRMVRRGTTVLSDAHVRAQGLFPLGRMADLAGDAGVGPRGPESARAPEVAGFGTPILRAPCLFTSTAARTATRSR